MVVKALNYIYDKILIVVFIILLLLGLYMTYDAWYIRYVSSGNSFSAYKPTKEDPEKYMKLGPDVIGWLYIDDTTIDYPLVQGKDNTKYLNTAPDGTYSLAGSIFLDWQCDPEFNMPFSLIYGHHISSRNPTKKPGPMFGALDMFNVREWFESHRTGLLTIKKGELKLDVFAFMITDANESIIFDPVHNTGQLDFIRKNSMYFYEPVNPERIVALSTCKDPGTTERTILFCSIIEE